MLEGFCRNLIVFVLIDLSWVFFRAASVEDALVILHRIADDCVSGRATAWNMLVQIPLIVFAKENLIPGILGIVLVTGVEWLVDLTKDAPAWRPARWPWFVRHAMYYAICIITLLFGVLGETRFIYFQF